MSAPTDPHPHLRLHDVAGVRILTIDRPEAKNALDTAMRTALVEVIAAADADPGVRVLVITAVDPVFTAGVDFKERPPGGPTRPVDWAFRPDPASALRATTTPSICAVNGACVSGGLEIALSATFVVASERARFADTHARLNVVPAWGLTALLPRAVGLRTAREMSITGAFVGADEALRLGLVNHVVPHADLLGFTLDLAGTVIDQPAVGEVLRLYDRGDGTSRSDALALERDWVAHRVTDVEAFRRLGSQTAPGGSPDAHAPVDQPDAPA